MGIARQHDWLLGDPDDRDRVVPRTWMSHAVVRRHGVAARMADDIAERRTWLDRSSPG